MSEPDAPLSILRKEPDPESVPGCPISGIVLLVISVLMGGQWSAMLVSCGAIGLSRVLTITQDREKNVLVWHGAKKLLVWVWKPLVSPTVLFHLHKKPRAPLRDKGNNGSQEK